MCSFTSLNGQAANSYLCVVSKHLHFTGKKMNCPILHRQLISSAFDKRDKTNTLRKREYQGNSKGDYFIGTNLTPNAPAVPAFMMRSGFNAWIEAYVTRDAETVPTPSTPVLDHS